MESMTQLDWGLIFQLINPVLLVVVAACWAIGYALKETPNVQNWTIIYIVTAISITLTVLILGFSAESIIQGVLCGAFSVYGHQFVKQGKKGGAKND